MTDSAVPRIQPDSAEAWAVLYLHDWDPPKEGQEHRWEPGKNVFPEIHNIYLTLQEADAVRRRMSDPNKYWVCRVHIPAPAVSPLIPFVSKLDWPLRGLADTDVVQCRVVTPDYETGGTERAFFGLTVADFRRLAALPSEAIGREWQPIETYDPSVGRASVLVVDCDVVSEAYYNGESDSWWLANTSEHDFDACRAIYPTHWMPLPAGPAVTRPHRRSPDEGK